jgi:hypothetical protein
MINTPIYKGKAQSDLDMAGFNLLNWAGGGGGGVARKFDVKTYGATGDGTTDDTIAIQAALAAIPSGGGVLYFPAGHYKYTGATLTLDRQIAVEGDGGTINVTGGWIDSTASNVFPAISTIISSSPTVPLFTVACDSCAFRNIELLNTSGTTPTAGAGIVVPSIGDFANFKGITVRGFYIGIDVQNGTADYFDNCLFMEPVLYGLRLKNIALPDGGDHFISNCQFWAPARWTATSAIRIESGGGPKFVNCKINILNFSHLWSYGIDLAVDNGVNTSDLLVSNCSIEGFSVAGIRGVTGSSSLWRNSVITGNQFQAFGSANPYAIKLAGTAVGDFNGWTITGNWAENVGTASSNPMIALSNCSNMVVTGNGELNFSDTLGIGSGVTWSKSPILTGGSYTVATLPTPVIGMLASVTDGTASLALGATVTGGGSAKYLCWYNGANWTVAGK